VGIIKYKTKEIQKVSDKKCKRGLVMAGPNKIKIASAKRAAEKENCVKQLGRVHRTEKTFGDVGRSHVVVISTKGIGEADHTRFYAASVNLARIGRTRGGGGGGGGVGGERAAAGCAQDRTSSPGRNRA